MAKQTGKGKVKVGIKDPQVIPEKEVNHTPPGKPPKRIRMLMSLASQNGSYPEGSVFLVPKEISVVTARSWLKSGAAEEDTSLPDPPEKK